MKSFTVAAVVALASVASAQSVSITDIPSSILTCLTPVAGSDGCGLTDFACQCKGYRPHHQDSSFASPRLPCADQQKGQSVLMQLCQQANVPISIPTPTCGGSASSAAPTSSAAAASSAASAAFLSCLCCFLRRLCCLISRLQGFILGCFRHQRRCLVPPLPPPRLALPPLTLLVPSQWPPRLLASSVPLLSLCSLCKQTAFLFFTGFSWLTGSSGSWSRINTRRKRI